MKQAGKELGSWCASVSQWWRSRRQSLRGVLLGNREEGNLPHRDATELTHDADNGEPSGVGAGDAGAAASAVGQQAPAAAGARGSHRLRSALGQTRGAARKLATALPGGVSFWIACITLGFVLAVLVANGHELLQLQLDGQGVLWLLLATGLTLASLVVNGIAWGGVLAWLGWQPRWEDAVSLFVVTNLRKYIPGGIWHLAARVDVLCGPQAPLTRSMSGGGALLVTVLEPLLAASAALALVAVGGWQNGLGVLGVVPLALLTPARLRQLLPALERRRAGLLEHASERDENAEELLRLPGYPWWPLVLELLFVLLRFGGFACCVWAFELQGIIPWTSWLAGFALAWTAGLVVPGAPGGLGVFETVLLLRLRVALPDSQLLAVALSYRLISTLADLLGAGLVEADQHLPRLLNTLQAALTQWRGSGWATQRLPLRAGLMTGTPRSVEPEAGRSAASVRRTQDGAATPEGNAEPDHAKPTSHLTRMVWLRQRLGPALRRGRKNPDLDEDPR